MISNLVKVLAGAASIAYVSAEEIQHQDQQQEDQFHEHTFKTTVPEGLTLDDPMNSWFPELKLSKEHTA